MMSIGLSKKFTNFSKFFKKFTVIIYTFMFSKLAYIGKHAMYGVKMNLKNSIILQHLLQTR